MKQIPYNEMQKLFDQSITEVFNDKFKNCDSVDEGKMEGLILIKGIRDFYFTVGLKFIVKHLTEISKK